MVDAEFEYRELTTEEEEWYRECRAAEGKEPMSGFRYCARRIIGSDTWFLHFVRKDEL